MVENLAQVAFLAYVLMQFTNTLVKPIVELMNLLFTDGDWRKHLISMWPMYLTTSIAGVLGWYAHYNMLPMLDAPLGHILTAIGIGLGPSFIYDLQDKEGTTLVVESIPSEYIPGQLEYRECSEDCSDCC